MIVKGYTLVNENKAAEAVTAANEGGDDVILAEYDKRGGLIKKGSEKIEAGTFWDFENATAKAVKKSKKTSAKVGAAKGKGKKK